MATNKKNLRNQLRSELHRQFKLGHGQSRHEQKKATGQHAHYDRIYSGNSLKVHLSQVDQFAKWAKEQQEPIRNLSDITPVIAGKYVQQREAFGYKSASNGATLTALNHVLVGSGRWQQPVSKADFGLQPRRAEDVVNNRTLHKQMSDLNEKHREILTFGQAFGLRRSELVPSARSNGYAATDKSIYEYQNKLYLATFGKGGRYRVVEGLESRQDYIKEQYGQYIQQVDTLPTAREFGEVRQEGTPLFDSIDRSIQVHILSRQYYANEKLNEIEQSGREFELSRQNSLESGYSEYRTNGRTMDRAHAEFISRQMGHNRIYELSKYVNLNEID